MNNPDMKKLRFALPLALLALAACTPAPPRQPEIAVAPTVKQTPPIKDHQDASPAVPPAAENTGRASRRVTPPSPAPSPAVLALLQEAEADSANGSLDNAAAALERAIRIQPRNAQLWQKLAEVRLKQHQPGLAEDLAKKSNVLAKNNKAMISKNWGLIAEARRKKGDMEGAAEADAKAGR